MSFQVEIGSLGWTVVFSGGTLYPFANYVVGTEEVKAYVSCILRTLFFALTRVEFELARNSILL